MCIARLALAPMLLALVFASGVSAQSTMYKCQSPSGEVSYGSSPCLEGHTQVWAKESAPASRSQAPARVRPERKIADREVKQVSSGTRTKGGHIACRRKEWMDDVVKFIGSKDVASGQAYLDRKWCLVLKPNIPVTITEWPSMFGGRVEFVANGVKLYSVRESLIYDN